MNKNYVSEFDAIYNGNPIETTKEKYEGGLREAILEMAAKWIDEKQGVRISIALNEVKRLDALFGTML